MPNVAGWDEAGEADTSSALAPGCANGQPTAFLCWDHPGWGQLLIPAAPFSCWMRGCHPTPSTGNGPVLFPQRKQSHPGSVTREQLMASNLLPCSITLFSGPERISCPALQHQTGPARYGATFLLAPSIASSSLLTSEVGPEAAFAGSLPDGEGSMGRDSCTPGQASPPKLSCALAGAAKLASEEAEVGPDTSAEQVSWERHDVSSQRC